MAITMNATVCEERLGIPGNPTVPTAVLGRKGERFCTQTIRKLPGLTRMDSNLDAEFGIKQSRDPSAREQ